MLSKERIALFPGSFDPITKGHEDIILRALHIFDKVVVGLGENSKKQKMFSFEQRKLWVEKTFEEYSNIEVTSYDGLTADYCKSHHITAIIRGIRNSADFDFERMVYSVNKSFNKELETVILFSAPELIHINSSIVRELILHNSDVGAFVPKKINVYE